MCSFARVSLAGLILLFFLVSVGTGAVKTAAPVKPAPAPKVLTVVAGQPFEVPPTSGPAKIALTMCADQTEPATFTVRSSKRLEGVSVACSNLVGPGTIAKQNVSVRLVRGIDLLPCAGLTLDSTPVQCWVDVSVPKGTKPGLYKGSIVFFVNGKQFDTAPIEVTVRPLRLIGSSKQYALYTSIRRDVSGASGLCGDDYGRFLDKVAQMGFRAVSVSGDPEEAGAALDECAAAGLTGIAPVLAFASDSCVPATEDIRTIEITRKAARIPGAFYFCADNPSTEADVQLALTKAAVLRQSGVQVAVTVSDEAAVQKLLPAVDGVNYEVSMPYVQALVNGGTSRTNKWEWYWWDARRSVNDNRINAGIRLWRSGLYGCMPVWMPRGEGDRADNLDSLLCEALREGVNDTRYITTYMKALRELKDKKRASDKDYIAATEAYLAGFLAKPLDRLTPADLRAFRDKMAEFSIKLAARL